MLNTLLRQAPLISHAAKQATLYAPARELLCQLYTL